MGPHGVVQSLPDIETSCRTATRSRCLANRILDEPEAEGEGEGEPQHGRGAGGGWQLPARTGRTQRPRGLPLCPAASAL